MSNQIENFMKMTKTYTKTQKNFTNKQNNKHKEINRMQNKKCCIFSYTKCKKSVAKK